MVNILNKNEFIYNKFGDKTNLMYIEDVEGKYKNLRYVKSVCNSCNEECIKQYASIYAGTITSCGKQKCKLLNNSLKKFKFEYGDKITPYLTYISENFDRTTSNHRYFKVRCNCGEIFSTRIDRKLDKCKKCSLQEKKDFITEKNVNTLINYLFKSYKKNALQRHYSFNIEFIMFKDLIFSNCYYCGSAPFNTAKRGNKTIKYNGIDRKNNELGYEFENCVTCCGKCNVMKNKWSHDDFINHIKTIINNSNL
jgi:hypothetical protein